MIEAQNIKNAPSDWLISRVEHLGNYISMLEVTLQAYVGELESRVETDGLVEFREQVSQEYIVRRQSE